MATTTIIGKVGITPQGEWSASRADYNRLDWVTYSGSSYMAIFKGGNIPVGTPVTDKVYWEETAKGVDTTKIDLNQAEININKQDVQALKAKDLSTDLKISELESKYNNVQSRGKEFPNVALAMAENPRPANYVSFTVRGSGSTSVDGYYVYLSTETGGYKRLQELPAISVNIKEIYVDAVSGLETNDGLTINTPVRTLTKMAALIQDGYSIYFKRGSVFRDENVTIASGYNFLKVRAYGNGERPCFDNFLPISNANIEKVAGYNNVYRIPRYYASSVANRTVLTVYVDGSRCGWFGDTYTIADQNTALAFLEANPGNAHWFSGGRHTTGWAAGNYYMYFSLSDSPANHLIEIQGALSQVLDIKATDVDIMDVNWRGPVSTDGVALASGNYENVNVLDFARHGCLFNSVRMKNCWAISRSGATGYFFHYITNKLSEKDLVFIDCGAISKLGRGGNGITGHLSTSPLSNYPYEKITINNFYCEGLENMGNGGSSTKRQEIENVKLVNCQNVFLPVNGYMKNVRGNLSGASAAVLPFGSDLINSEVTDIKVSIERDRSTICLINSQQASWVVGQIKVTDYEFVLVNKGSGSPLDLPLFNITHTAQSINFDKGIVAVKNVRGNKILPAGVTKSFINITNSHLIGVDNLGTIGSLSNTVFLPSYRDIYNSDTVGDYIKEKLYALSRSSIRMCYGGDMFVPTTGSVVELSTPQQAFLSPRFDAPVNVPTVVGPNNHEVWPAVNNFCYLKPDRVSFYRQNALVFTLSRLVNSMWQSFHKDDTGSQTFIFACQGGFVGMYRSVGARTIEVDTTFGYNYKSICWIRTDSLSFSLLLGTDTGQIVRTTSFPLAGFTEVATGLGSVNDIKILKDKANLNLAVGTLAACNSYQLKKSPDLGAVWASVVLPRYPNGATPNIIQISHDLYNGIVVCLIDTTNTLEPNILVSMDNTVTWSLRYANLPFKPTRLMYGEYHTNNQTRSGWYATNDSDTFCFSPDLINWKSYQI